MEKSNHQYRMNKLMNCNELEAFTAQRSSGSTNAYFDRIHAFNREAPQLVTELTTHSTIVNTPLFMEKMQTLQRHLLAIGSPSLLWLAEKTTQSALTGNKVKCEDGAFILAGRVRALCSLLDDAKIDATASGKHPTPEDAAPPAPAAPAQKAARPQAPIRQEPFEKVNILIENFERDDAMAMLSTLMRFTYSKSVDTVLVATHDHLTGFNYDGASLLMGRLVEAIKKSCAEGAKAAKKKVLAVDDVPDILNTVTSVLKDDCAVYGVTNHMAALKFLTGNSADLILLDIEMPDMDGFTLLSIIRKIIAYENTPILFLTGNVNVENIKKARAAGASDFITKPVEPTLLREKVSRYLA